jgi:UDP-N-acetylglucosamine--N-acetylmuramyl-(pentapeptide) pyrophosphoryl-undecaprenol N-acetylglucosamine transferase
MAVADELRARGASVSFLGTRNRIEAQLVPAAGYEIDFLSALGIDRRNPVRAAKAVFKAATATGTARAHLRHREPDVVVGGGGFVAGPAGLAATSMRIPLVLTEADSHLGLANRLLARRARRVCLAFPIEGREDDSYLVTGRPIPRSVLEADRARARERFGIDPTARCLLVMGGSQGARSINSAAADAFLEPEKTGGLPEGLHVLHLAGRRDYPELRDRMGQSPPVPYTLLEYEPNLGDTLAASDLVLGRSGGSIFEVLAVGRPAVLVPYPHATADHQASNAEWMRERGAALVITDAELDGDRVRSIVGELLGDPGTIEQMAGAASAAARPDAAASIADEVMKAAGE